MEKFKDDQDVLGLSDSEKGELLVVNLTDHFQLRSIIGNKLKAKWLTIETESQWKNGKFNIKKLLINSEPNGGENRIAIIWGIYKDDEGVGENADDFTIVEQQGGLNG